jgi:S-formylglutathione hydrolase FrmB
MTRRHYLSKTFLSFFLLLVLHQAASSQEVPPQLRPKGLKVQLAPSIVTLSFESRSLARRVSYNVILPQNYAEKPNAGRRYPVIYLLHGLGGHFDNWTDKTKVGYYALPLDVIIVTPEGGDGWYTDSATVPNDKYESYLIQDLLPEVEGRFRTFADRDHRFIAGLSMGGYGAIKFAIRYPEKFALAGSFSGVLDAATADDKEYGLASAITKSIFDVFGPIGSKTRNENDLFRMVRELTSEKLKSLPFIYMGCGTEDKLCSPNNHDFLALLNEKKVPHEYRELPAIHSWVFWDDQAREFLAVADRYVKKIK